MATKFTFPQSTGGAVTPVLCQNITLSVIQGLIASNTLVCGRLYTITNPFSNSVGYGTVTVKATSNNSLDPNAVWNKTDNGVSIGGLLYDSTMTVGNTIDTVRVNGIDLIAAPIPFNTSLFTTMGDLATAINSLAATSLIAIPTYSGIILKDTIVQTTYNNAIPGSLCSGFFGVIQNYTLLFGEDPTNPAIQLPVIYDVNNASLLSCYDYRYNNTINSFNNDTVIFTFPFNYSIVNSTFSNTFFDQSSIYAAFIDIDNSNFNNCAFFNILFNTLRIIDSTLNNIQASAATDGIDFGISNCRLLYPKLGPGLIFGSYITYPLLYTNVETDGRNYQCSGDIAFSGNPGSGAVGTPVFLQSSPNRFSYKFTYRVKLFGQSIVGNPGATLEIGTNTNPSGLVNSALSSSYNGVVNLVGNSFGPDPYGEFITTPAIDNTNSGILTYVISGFLVV